LGGLRLIANGKQKGRKHSCGTNLHFGAVNVFPASDDDVFHPVQNVPVCGGGGGGGWERGRGGGLNRIETGEKGIASPKREGRGSTTKEERERHGTSYRNRRNESS
jgi:hypothetical protein